MKLTFFVGIFSSAAPSFCVFLFLGNFIFIHIKHDTFMAGGSCLLSKMRKYDGMNGKNNMKIEKTFQNEKNQQQQMVTKTW